MNAPERVSLLPDIQSQPDSRNLPVHAVGIHGVRYPLTIAAGGRLFPTVASLSLSVGLAAHVKGTHMSRFIELLEAQTAPLNGESLRVDPQPFRLCADHQGSLSRRTQ